MTMTMHHLIHSNYYDVVVTRQPACCFVSFRYQERLILKKKQREREREKIQFFIFVRCVVCLFLVLLLKIIKTTVVRLHRTNNKMTRNGNKSLSSSHSSEKNLLGDHLQACAQRQVERHLCV